MSSKELDVPRALPVVKEVMDRVQTHAAKTLEGLYKKPGDPEYNDDADKTWAECSMRTRAALILAKSAQDQGGGDGKPLGIVFLSLRANSSKEWEAKAREVDANERVIDVEADGK